MGLDVYFNPMVRTKTLKEDTNLSFNEDGLVTLKDNPKSAIRFYDPKDEYLYYVRVFGGSEEILRYLAETYELLVAADGCLDDAGYALQYSESEKEYEDNWIRFGVAEMLKYSEVYKWSEEYKEKLQKKLSLFQNP